MKKLNYGIEPYPKVENQKHKIGTFIVRDKILYSRIRQLGELLELMQANPDVGSTPLKIETTIETIEKLRKKIPATQEFYSERDDRFAARKERRISEGKTVYVRPMPVL